MQIKLWLQALQRAAGATRSSTCSFLPSWPRPPLVARSSASRAKLEDLKWEKEKKVAKKAVGAQYLRIWSERKKTKLPKNAVAGQQQFKKKKKTIVAQKKLFHCIYAGCLNATLPFLTRYFQARKKNWFKKVRRPGLIRAVEGESFRPMGQIKVGWD